MRNLLIATTAVICLSSTAYAQTGNYYPSPPCRALDHETFTKDFFLTPASSCTVPNNTLGIIIHVTVLNPSIAGHLTIFQPYGNPLLPSSLSVPLLAQLNWQSGQTVNGMTIVPFDSNNPNGLYFVPVYGVTGQVVVDIIGYFVQ